MNSFHQQQHQCSESPVSYATMGGCRRHPGTRFLTPIFFSASCGHPCTQSFDEVTFRITGFSHLSIGEEYQDISERIGAAPGDDVIYGFETAGGEFLFGPGRDLASRLVADPRLVGDCPSTADAVRHFVLLMGVSTPTPLARFASHWWVRVIFVLGVVFGTYNPSGYSYAEMVRSGPFTPVEAVTGLLLLICWIALLAGCLRTIRRWFQFISSTRRRQDRRADCVPDKKTRRHR